MPLLPGIATSPAATDAQRLWSVIAATSRPAARIEAKASAGSPFPSDSVVWLCRSAWTSQGPENSRECLLVPQASLSGSTNESFSAGRPRACTVGAQQQRAEAGGHGSTDDRAHRP